MDVEKQEEGEHLKPAGIGTCASMALLIVTVAMYFLPFMRDCSMVLLCFARTYDFSFGEAEALNLLDGLFVYSIIVHTVFVVVVVVVVKLLDKLWINEWVCLLSSNLCVTFLTHIIKSSSSVNFTMGLVKEYGNIVFVSKVVQNTPLIRYACTQYVYLVIAVAIICLNYRCADRWCTRMSDAVKKGECSFSEVFKSMGFTYLCTLSIVAIISIAFAAVCEHKMYLVSYI